MSTGWEMGVRLGVFAAVFALMAIWEILAERRARRCSRRRRWLANLGLVVLDAAVVRLVFPLTLVGAAMMAEAHGSGLLPGLSVPPVVALSASVIVLDLALYLQHVLFHAVPALWRLHMVHHADLDFDLTTGLRFHPLEIVLSLALKIGVVVLLGAPPLAVLIFEALLNGTSLFNHGNVSLPAKLDMATRWLLVTPDMHRVHHSVERVEANSNFGFCLSWWDRLLGTYRQSPEAGHDGMQIGLSHLQSRANQSLPWLLALPFRGTTGAYPLSDTGKRGARSEEA